MSHIFISYSPKDHSFVEELSEQIHEQLGLDIFIPDYQPEFFSEHIEQFLTIPEEVIRTALLFIRLETPQVLNHYTCQRELQLALEYERPILCLTSLGQQSALANTDVTLIEASLDQTDNIQQILRSIERFLIEPFVESSHSPPDLDRFIQDQFNKLQDRIDDHERQAQIQDHIAYTVTVLDGIKLTKLSLDTSSVISHLIRAEMYFHNFKPQQAEKLCQDILKSSNQSEVRVYVYKLLGDIKLFSASYVHARHFFKQVISIAQSTTNHSCDIQVYACMQIGNTYRHQARYPQAHHYLTQAYHQAQAINNLPLTSDTLGYLGKLVYSKGDFDTAKVMLREALVIANKIGSQERRARHLRHLGRVYDKQQLVGIAERCYEKSLQISTAIDDAMGQCSTFRYLGLMHLKQNNIDTALFSCQQALSIAQQLNHPRTQIRALCSLGSIFYVQKDCDEALDIFMQAFGVANKSQLRLEKAYTVACLARIMLLQLTISPTQQKLKDAFSNFQQSIDLLKQVNESHKLFSEHRLNQYTQTITQLFQQLQTQPNLLNRKLGTRQDTSVGVRLQDFEDIYRGVLEDHAVIDDTHEETETVSKNENLQMLQEIYDEMIGTLFDEQGLNCNILMSSST